MMFLVDSNGDGVNDHFIPVFGYNQSNREYAFYTTWSENENVVWKSFRRTSSSYRWGIGWATYITPGAPDLSHPVPEPTTMLLMGTGLIALFGIGRKKYFPQRSGSGLQSNIEN